MKWYKRYYSNRDAHYQLDLSETKYPRFIEMLVAYTGNFCIRTEGGYRYLHIRPNGEIWYTDDCYRVVYRNGDRHDGAEVR